MNLLLLQALEVDDTGIARLSGRRLEHAREVLRVQAGQTLKVGVLGGLMGTAEVISQDGQSLVLQVSATQPPPPRAGVSLVSPRLPNNRASSKERRLVSEKAGVVMKKAVWVSPTQSGEWKVQTEGAGRAAAIVPTQSQAIDRAGHREAKPR